jgi:hypothetical protein
MSINGLTLLLLAGAAGAIHDATSTLWTGWEVGTFLFAYAWLEIDDAVSAHRDSLYKRMAEPPRRRAAGGPTTPTTGVA